jgi:hypothetical protein
MVSLFEPTVGVTAPLSTGLGPFAGEDKRLEDPMFSVVNCFVYDEGISVIVHKPEYWRSSRKARCVCR